MSEEAPTPDPAPLPDLKTCGDYWVLLFGLNQRQEAFVRHYLDNGGNGTGAYMAAYDVSEASTAAPLASKLLKNDKVQQVIMSARGLAFERALDRFDLRAQDVVRGLAQIARADLRDLVEVTEHGQVKIRPTTDWTGDAAMAVSGLRITPGKYGPTISVQLADRNAALTALARHFGLLLDRSATQPLSAGDVATSPADELATKLQQLAERGVA